MIDTSILNPQYVPEEGPCIIVANHRSDLDPFLILFNVQRPISWMAASYLWNMPVFKQLMDNLGAIPISKFQSEIRHALSKADEILENGGAIGIFPEGWDYIAQNQFDWSVGKFQTGFARIALRTGAPVVPMAILGLDEIRVRNPLPPFMRKIFGFPIEMQYIKDRCVYRKIHINVGKPIPVPAGADPEDRDAIMAFTELVNDRVRELYNELPRSIAGFENIEPKPAGPPKEKVKAGEESIRQPEPGVIEVLIQPEPPIDETSGDISCTCEGTCDCNNGISESDTDTFSEDVMVEKPLDELSENIDGDVLEEPSPAGEEGQ